MTSWVLPALAAAGCRTELGIAAAAAAGCTIRNASGTAPAAAVAAAVAAEGTRLRTAADHTAAGRTVADFRTEVGCRNGAGCCTVADRTEADRTEADHIAEPAAGCVRIQLRRKPTGLRLESPTMSVGNCSDTKPARAQADYPDGSPRPSGGDSC